MLSLTHTQALFIPMSPQTHLLLCPHLYPCTQLGLSPDDRAVSSLVSIHSSACLMLVTSHGLQYLPTKCADNTPNPGAPRPSSSVCSLLLAILCSLPTSMFLQLLTCLYDWLLLSLWESPQVCPQRHLFCPHTACFGAQGLPVCSAALTDSWGNSLVY